MDIYRLLKDELSYELFIRDQPTEGCVQDLRRRLSKALSDKVPVLERCFAALEVEEELNICETKWDSIQSQLEVAELTETNEIKRFRTRLIHLKDRLWRIATKDDNEKRRQELLSRVKNSLKELENATATVPQPIKEEGAVSQQDRPVLEVGNHIGNSPEVRQPTERDIRLYKWNLTFSGDDQSPSLCSFLAQVEDRQMSRGITKEELFRSASELFRGTALVWYRTKRNSFKTWDDLVSHLRKAFLDVDYDHQLMEEIYRRTQGPLESPTTYIAKMQGLFSCLSTEMSEENKLAIIARNVKKEYRGLLPLTTYTTVDELEAVLSKLEIGATMASRYREPPVKGALEPDLAYRGGHQKNLRTNPIACSSSLDSNTSKTTSYYASKVKCWNCQKPGHVHRMCRSSKKTFCVGCGQQGILKEKCSRCTPRQGNDQGGRA